MTDTANKILEAAIQCAGYDWRIVILHPRSKRPRGEGWRARATSDDEALIERFERWPESNIGLLLGPESGVIDLEFDDDEGKETAERLVGEAYTPTYRSERSIHRLFRWSPALPNVQKWIHKGLEVRIGGDEKSTQSVLPPSIHPNGGQYEWLMHPEEHELAEVPDCLLALMFNEGADDPLGNGHVARTQEYWNEALAGVAESGRNAVADGLSGRNAVAASLIGKLLRDLADPFDNSAISRLWMMIDGWNTKNRPPLSEAELRTTFDSIVQRHRIGTTDRRADGELAAEVPADQQAPESGGNGGRYKLVIVESRPRVYRLYSPLWSGLTSKGYIELTTSQYRNVDKILDQALEQADAYVTRKKFAALWNGDKKNPSLARQLVETAERMQASPEQNRQAVVAEHIYTMVAGAPEKPKNSPDARGRPQRIEDGSVVFVFSTVLEDFRHAADRVTRMELSAVLEICEAKLRWFTCAGGSKKRFRVIDKAAFGRLKTMISGGEDE